MNLTQDRVRVIGWISALVLTAALLVALTFRVNAVKSQVRLAERQIAALQSDKILLETEFETRASQHQLKALNDVEFGYQAPTSGQYLESERDLAALGKARGPDAPEPIRVASAASNATDAPFFPEMVSPLSGEAFAAEPGRNGKKSPTSPSKLADRLSRIDEARQVTAGKAVRP